VNFHRRVQIVQKILQNKDKLLKKLQLRNDKGIQQMHSIKLSLEHSHHIYMRKSDANEMYASHLQTNLQTQIMKSYKLKKDDMNL
jgi:hypothetical protein